MNHIRDCAADSGTRAGRATAVTRGSTWSRPSIASASSSTVGASNTSRTDTDTPNTSATPAATRIADNELPPNKKNDSPNPTRDTPNTRSNTCATNTCDDDTGATNPTSATTTGGNARRSNFPELFNTNSSVTTHTDGHI
ncbi:Uncharacterised protein [Mycobacteroides abscessus subsp. abscessus]|nr:Uncharacterised protein [Mycobacteroides abscessus subsp. abscessus]